jgi:asparagine synthase (glutamine-hydrolysing)
MCGICGIYNFRDSGVVDMRLLRVMNNTMRHRGPNDEGYFNKTNIGLAMRRLSIIDVAGGRQPIPNENKTKWIVFNGEIYNYRELRQVLSERGHSFSTNSDTEAILHLYEDFGDNCVNYLRGMFAFAIWDSTAETLFIARDRIGIKPLFYSIVGNKTAIFASEIKALLAYPEIDKDIDLQALDAFFTYSYIPAPLSIFKGIRKLPPAHVMKINQHEVSIKKYWDLYFQPDHSKTESYFTERFEEIFADSVKMRLLSEVPLGAFLSGGIDSGMIVAQMARFMTDSPHTFTVGFTGDTGAYLDERPYARMIAQKYACNHTEIEVKPNINEVLDEIVDAFDEPFADDSVVPSYYICKSSKKVATVVLTGLGGDELFAGYERYLGFQLSLLYDYVPSLVSRRIISPLIELLPEQKNGSNFINHMKRFIRASHLPLPIRYAHYISLLGPETRKKLFSSCISGKIDFSGTLDIMTTFFNSSDNAEQPLDRIFYQDIKTYLPDDILTLTDRVGMQHSQELRVPFTDHVLMEFCATIPAEMKIKKLEKKYLLKKSARKFIPSPVLSHRKQGFSSPLAQWFKTDLKPLCAELLSKEKIENHGVLNWEFVKTILSRHQDRRELYDKLIFSIIMFQKWYERIYSKK